LSQVNVVKNNISTIEDHIFQGVESIKMVMNFRGNRISTIHKDAFAGLYADTSIDLSFNNISKLHEDTLQDLRGLFMLKLANNKISSLPKSLFRNQDILFLLDLRDNRIESLDKELFNGLIALESLNLNKNKLKSIPDGLFEKNSLLRTISLESNLFSYPPANIPSRVKITLKNNPIQCDCELKDILSNPTIKNQIRDIDVITCDNYKHLSTKNALAELDCRPSTTTVTTTRALINNLNLTTTKYVTSSPIKKNNTIIEIEESTGKSSTTVILSVILALLVLAVIIAVFVYLYRRNIATKLSEVASTLPRHKKRTDRLNSSADDVVHCEGDGWVGSKTAMFSKTECDV